MTRLWVPVFVALLLPALGAACGATSACVEPMSRTTAAHRVRNAAQQTADQGLARQVRRSILDDSGLVSAARAVAVTSRHGVVRLVGWVRTHKERSSIVFKAGQIARSGGVDDHVTVGDCAAGAAR